MNTYYKDIGEMTERELKGLAVWCFTCATGVTCAQNRIVLLESGHYENGTKGDLWFRVGVIYFYIECDGINKRFYISNERKERLEQF